MIFENSKVPDDEILYRAVPHGRGRIKQLGELLRPSSDCFLDPSHQISVDRASKCGHNPSYTQREISDYVCRLLAGRVREIEGIGTHDRKGRPLTQHAINVYDNPLGQRCSIRDRSEQPENLAHALVIAHPHIEGKSTFRRLKEALCQISEWEPNYAPTEPN